MRDEMKALWRLIRWVLLAVTAAALLSGGVPALFLSGEETSLWGLPALYAVGELLAWPLGLPVRLLTWVMRLLFLPAIELFLPAVDPTGDIIPRAENLLLGAEVLLVFLLILFLVMASVCTVVLIARHFVERQRIPRRLSPREEAVRSVVPALFWLLIAEHVIWTEGLLTLRVFGFDEIPGFVRYFQLMAEDAVPLWGSLLLLCALLLFKLLLMLCLCLLLYAAALRGKGDHGRTATRALLLLTGAAVLTGPGAIHVGVTLFDMFNEGFLFSQKLTAGDGAAGALLSTGSTLLCAIGPAVCVCWLCCVGQAGEGV